MRKARNCRRKNRKVRIWWLLAKRVTKERCPCNCLWDLSSRTWSPIRSTISATRKNCSKWGCKTRKIPFWIQIWLWKEVGPVSNRLSYQLVRIRQNGNWKRRVPGFHPLLTDRPVWITRRRIWGWIPAKTWKDPSTQITVSALIRNWSLRSCTVRWRHR